MKILLLSAVAVLCSVGLVSGVHKFPFSTEIYEDNILILDESNFDQEVPTYDILLVDFAIPWCTHCKILYPEYAKAADMLREHEPEYYLAKVDTFKSEALKKRFKIKHFPTIKLFKNGVEIETYYGKHTAQDIVDYVLSKAAEE